MAAVCPLCNGLAAIQEYCPLCGQILADGGVLQDFYGPYSPYMEQRGCGEEAGNCRTCLHLLYCSACGYDRRQRIGRVEIRGVEDTV